MTSGVTLNDPFMEILNPMDTWMYNNSFSRTFICDAPIPQKFCLVSPKMCRIINHQFFWSINQFKFCFYQFKSGFSLLTSNFINAEKGKTTFKSLPVDLRKWMPRKLMLVFYCPLLTSPCQPVKVKTYHHSSATELYEEA